MKMHLSSIPHPGSNFQCSLLPAKLAIRNWKLEARSWKLETARIPQQTSHGPASALSSFQLPDSILHRGFTLIELMLVVIIIGVLAAMVVPRLAGRSEEARVAAAKADIKGNVSMALRLYEVDNGRYPSTEQGLTALMAKPTSAPVPPNWKGPYIEQEPLDPWGKSYLYRYPGTHPPREYDLYSAGADGQDGTNDDVTNWQ